MELQTSKPRLAAQDWFIAFLASKGFHPSLPDTFSNGKATIRIRGNNLIADPGNGDKCWQSDIADAEETSITLVVGQLLKLPSFRTDADLAKERAERQRLEQALDGIAASIKEGPDTGGGVQLRRFLWSLYNQHHLVNLWRMTASLDSQHAAWVSQVFAGAMTGLLKEHDLKRALAASGEMRRWDSERPDTEALRKLEDAEHLVSGLARATLPSRSHTQIADLLGQFSKTRQILRSEDS